MNIIEGIIERKKQGIEPSEQDNEQIKNWLEEIRMVGDQKTEGQIQLLFPRLYNEWLEENEMDDWTRDYSEERDHESYNSAN